MALHGADGARNARDGYWRLGRREHQQKPYSGENVNTARRHCRGAAAISAPPLVAGRAAIGMPSTASPWLRGAI